MSSLFDRYAIVDWSASNTPVTGKNSVWIAFAERDEASGEARLTETINPPTRTAAMAALRQFLRDALADGKRVFAGFDFAFGYPRGGAEAIAGEAGWSALWRYLGETVKDLDDNTNNRFEVAGRLNRDKLAHAPMFWGRPQFQEVPGLPPVKPQPYPDRLPERRRVEERARSAQPVWKLHTTGAVGSQTLMGIARLEQLRQDPEFAGRIAVWPFETGFASHFGAPIVLGEIYPSLVERRQGEASCVDEAQVRAVAELFADRDAKGVFGELLAAPEGLNEADLGAVLREEGWIAGLGLHPPVEVADETTDGSVSAADAPGRSGGSVDYLRDPAAIHDENIRLIRAEADLSHLPERAEDMAIRIVNSCGMADIVADLLVSEGAIEAGQAALEAGMPILCDSEMVSHGILSAKLPHQNKIVCRVNDPRTRRIGEREGTTRSAAQVDLWGDLLENAIVAIGSAPTALFRLLEKLDAGAPRPALIVGLPVGFVGSAEAKAELARHSRGVPFVTLKGRRGGSPMAAAAVNSLAISLADRNRPREEREEPGQG